MQEEDDKGFLITCDKHKQKQAIKDAYNFISEYIEDEYGDLPNELIKQSIIASGKKMSLQNQLDAAKQNKQNRLLMNVDTKVNCLVFIKVNQIFAKKVDVNLIATKVMNDVHKDEKQVSRFCHKLMPVEKAFKAEHFRMIDKIREMFEDRQKNNKQKEIKSWALNFKCRNNSKFNYKEILGQIQDIAKGYGHFVDIFYPQWTVCVEIVHHLMCLSIVQNYKQYQQYRLHQKAPNLRALIPNPDKKKRQQQENKSKKERKNQKIVQKQKKEKEKSSEQIRQDNVEVKQYTNKQLLAEKIQADEQEEVDFI